MFCCSQSKKKQLLKVGINAGFDAIEVLINFFNLPVMRLNLLVLYTTSIGVALLDNHGE
jgi:hypothetical protein